MRSLLPPGWPRPKGYANAIEAKGRTLWLAGQIGWTPDETFESDDFIVQFDQALANIVALLAEGGAGPEHVVRMTWFVTSKAEYLSRLGETGAVYRRHMGKHFPAMTVVEVSALMEDRAKVEIEATAVIED